jgi:hypothetical protein
MQDLDGAGAIHAWLFVHHLSVHHLLLLLPPLLFGLRGFRRRRLRARSKDKARKQQREQCGSITKKREKTNHDEIIPECGVNSVRELF